MKLLRFEKKEAKISVEDADDLYALNQIIEQGDILKAKSFRKIKIGKEGDRKQEVERKPMVLSIRAEKTEYSPQSGVLRVTGVITDGPEEVQKGEHHTFNLEAGTIFELSKGQWLNFQLQRLKEAASEKSSRVLVCVMDREEAHFALLKRYGYEVLSSLKGKVSKKGMDESGEGKFYQEIISQLSSYSERYGLIKIILASPAFWKEEVFKEAHEKSLKAKILLATCNAVGRNGINEVLKRPEVKEALKEDRIAREVQLVDDLLQEISKQNFGAYGIEETGKAAEAGAVKELLVTDGCISKHREHGTYPLLEGIFKITEQAKGTVHIISSGHDGGQQLDGLGGIGALLRFKLNY
ncbi:mRNA surveillance protein pelota [Candidatus Woesearchaeota archaeon]|nr:mRNA surveillance protein pelota [Candidatus Woesearchaeota archaeon]